MRDRAVAYIESGGKRSEACRIFKIDPKTLYNWLKAGNAPKRGERPRFRKRKLDKQTLLAHVQVHPDMVLRERAAHFDVRINSIWVALKALGVTKKNDTLCGEVPKKSDKLYS